MNPVQVTLPEMPLAMVKAGEKVLVKSIKGKDDTKRFLNNLGFVENAEATIVSELNGNIIVNIKDARVAISKALANRILTVSQE